MSNMAFVEPINVGNYIESVLEAPDRSMVLVTDGGIFSLAPEKVLLEEVPEETTLLKHIPGRIHSVLVFNQPKALPISTKGFKFSVMITTTKAVLEFVFFCDKGAEVISWGSFDSE